MLGNQVKVVGDANNSSRPTTLVDQTQNGTAESRVDKKISEWWSTSFFLVIVLLTLANCKPNNILAHLWVVFAAIVCPLINLFIPGIFYYKVMKEEEEDEEEEKRCSCDKFKRCLARFYTILGALLLPTLLTLATKALFSTTVNTL